MSASHQALLMASGLIIPPDALSGLALWIDGTDAATLLQTSAGSAASADSDPVGLAKSKDTTGTRGLYQATAGSRPLLRTGVINGKSVLRFDGSNDWAKSAVHSAGSVSSDASQNTMLGGGTAATIIWAGTIGSNASGGSAMSQKRGLVAWGGSVGPILSVESSGGSGTAYAASFYADTASGCAQVAISTATPLILSMRVNGASVQLRVNRGSWSSTTPSSQTFNAAAYLRASLSGNDSLYTVCDLAHLCLYNSALSDGNLDLVEDYIAAQLGIVL